MKYYWIVCPRCRCEVAINTSDSPLGVSGSLRRWSADRTINDGRQVQIPTASFDAGGGFSVECVCGETLRVTGLPDAVGAERDRS